MKTRNGWISIACAAVAVCAAVAGAQGLFAPLDAVPTDADSTGGYFEFNSPGSGPALVLATWSNSSGGRPSSHADSYVQDSGAWTLQRYVEDGHGWINAVRSADGMQAWAILGWASGGTSPRRIVMYSGDGGRRWASLGTFRINPEIEEVGGLIPTDRGLVVEVRPHGVTTPAYYFAYQIGEWKPQHEPPNWQELGRVATQEPSVTRSLLSQVQGN